MTFKASPMFSDDLPDDVREMLRAMIGQLPIVFALRNGGQLRIPASEIDATGQYMLDIEMDGTDFIFKASKKS